MPVAPTVEDPRSPLSDTAFRKQIKRRRATDAWPRLLWAAAALVSFVILVHVLVIFWASFLDRPSGATGLKYGLHHYVVVYSDPYILRVFLNTLAFSATTLVVALGFGLPISFLVTRTDLRGSAFIFSMMTATLLMPGFIPALGWLFVLHPKVGMANTWLASTFGAGAPVIPITNVIGMGWVQGLNLAPLAFIMTAAVFRSMDPSLEEAASTCGARQRSVLARITLPLAWPGILSASIFIFMVGFAAMDAPAIIGMANRVFTFSTYSLSLISSHDGSPNYGAVAALSVPLFAFGMLMSLWYMRMQQRARQFAVVTGKAYRPKPIALGSNRTVAYAFVGLYLVLSVLLPLTVLAWVSLLPFVQLPGRVAWTMASLDNFRLLDWSTALTGMKNTAILMLLVASCVTVLSFATSWTVLRSRSRLRAVFDLIAFLPHVVPNVLFSIAVLFIALFVISGIVPIYGTIWVLFIALVIVRMSYGTRMLSSAMIQIHRELEEVAQVCGASSGQVIVRVLLPLIAPALWFTWLWTALLTCRELSVVMFLTTSDNLTLPMVVWSNFNGGEQGAAAALSLVLIVLMLPLIWLYSATMKRFGVLAA